MSAEIRQPRIPQLSIDVVEFGCKPRRGRRKFELDADVTFSTSVLESYAFAPWEPTIYDAMVVAAAVEYADKIIKRPALGWTRKLSVRIPVHDVERWSSPAVSVALHDAIRFLTGDDWAIAFTGRKARYENARQTPLALSVPTQAVVAFSDGMDSRAVAGLIAKTLGDKLVRVRVGSKVSDRPKAGSAQSHFTSVPYQISWNKRGRDSTARSRGFKFALIAGLAAYLTKAPEIVVTESGQGSIAPVLVHVGHIHPDYRNHPLFTQRMECFLAALLGRPVRYVFPRIWSTKGETLREYTNITSDETWKLTKSCWRGNQWSVVDGSARQCGVCAACMLRRLSVHAAGLSESDDTYIATDMKAKSLTEALDPKFTKMNKAFREYAIAGILHMDHFADLASPDARPTLRAHAAQLAPALRVSAQKAEEQLTALVDRHALEWRNYVASLGEHSFVRQWTRTRP